MNVFFVCVYVYAGMYTCVYMSGDQRTALSVVFRAFNSLLESGSGSPVRHLGAQSG